jgi:hypothetical protein
MEEHAKDGQVGRAALRADLDRKTARKYLELGRLPSELVRARDWRTRQDPFEEDWPWIEGQLSESQGAIEARTLLEHLIEKHPDRYQEGHLRTLQRRVQRWRATKGPSKEIFFPQNHRPGEAMQTDFTHGTELGVTIAGDPFAHLICHSVLPYSNWEWPTVCRSESTAAIRRGVQGSVFRLGKVTVFHQTDHSTAATHDLGQGLRGFNQEYLALMKHLGMKPRTTKVGEKEQNGDVEAANGAFKRRARQALLLRGSSDFESKAAYERWLQEEVAEKANRGRRKKLQEELAVMRPVVVERLAEFTEETVRVRSGSTIHVKRNTYSVPSRLIGEWVRARVYEDRIEVWYAGEVREVMERLVGAHRARINYRHIIESLVRKPGAFERYRYRDALFPSLTFRKAYDHLREALPPTQADLHYLRILHLAARTMESEVEQALVLLLEAGVPPRAEEVKGLVAPEMPSVPVIAAPVVSLSEYDTLLGSAKEDAG